jgi:hypothetical protein
MTTSALAAAAVAVLLVFVLLRILRIGCRLVVWAICFVALVIAAAILYSVLGQMDVLDQLNEHLDR